MILDPTDLIQAERRRLDPRTHQYQRHPQQPRMCLQCGQARSAHIAQGWVARLVRWLVR